MEDARAPGVSALIVGYGVITAVGADANATFDALVAGRTGIRPIRRFDASTFPVRFGAEVDSALDGPDLYDALADAVVTEALAGVDLSGVAPERIGVWMGCEAVRPDIDFVASTLLQHIPPPEPDPFAIARYHPARQANRVAHRVGARGPVATLSIACTSSAQAVGEAMMAIRRGEVDVAIAGGVDVLVNAFMVLGFSRLGALSQRNDAPERASRPFDLGRDGFVLGDGAGAMVLANAAIAGRLGKQPVGRVTGYASTCNAWRITDTPPDGRGTRVAMLQALADAGRRPSDVAYLNAHGTSTPQNDAGEAAAIRAALGASSDQVPVSSTKSMTGHTVAACGVIEAIIALQAITRRVAPPTINLDTPDPDCALHHVANVAAPIDAGVGMSNAAGFGGSNTALVVELA